MRKPGKRALHEVRPVKKRPSPLLQWCFKRLFESDDAWEACLVQTRQGVENLSNLHSESTRDLNRVIGDIKIELEALGVYSYLKLMNDKFKSENILRQQRYTQLESHARTIFAKYVDSIHKRYDSEPSSDVDRSSNEALSGRAKLRQFENTFADLFYSVIQRDTCFEEIRVDGVPITVNIWNLGGILQCTDRSIRERAFASFYKRIAERKYTLADLYINHCRLHTALSAEGKGCFDRELDGLGIDYRTYERYRALARSFVPEVTRYYQLKFAWHKIGAPRLYDLTIPMGRQRLKFDFNKALELIAGAMAPFGDGYCNVLRDSAKKGWIQIADDNLGHSGSFTVASYKSGPFVSLRFRRSSFNDLMTLAHELGHAVHYHYSRNANSFRDYKFLALDSEIVAVFQEQMLLRYLIDREPSAESRCFLLSRVLDDYDGNFLRQMRFTEFEDEVFQLVSSQEPLDLDRLKMVYLNILQIYLGQSVELGDSDHLECLRTPHFYRSFYVFRYTIAINAALFLVRRIHQDKDFSKAFVGFLENGRKMGTRKALSALGIDLVNCDYVKSGFNYFSESLKQLIGDC